MRAPLPLACIHCCTFSLGVGCDELLAAGDGYDEMITKHLTLNNMLTLSTDDDDSRLEECVTVDDVDSSS